MFRGESRIPALESFTRGGGFRDVCFSLVPQVLLLLSKFGANTVWKKANDD